MPVSKVDTAKEDSSEEKWERRGKCEDHHTWHPERGEHDIWMNLDLNGEVVSTTSASFPRMGSDEEKNKFWKDLDEEGRDIPR